MGYPQGVTQPTASVPSSGTDRDDLRMSGVHVAVDEPLSNR